MQYSSEGSIHIPIDLQEHNGSIGFLQLTTLGVSGYFSMGKSHTDLGGVLYVDTRRCSRSSDADPNGNSIQQLHADAQLQAHSAIVTANRQYV